MVLLRPLYYATFKVLVVADYRVYVIEFRKDSFEEETAAIFIPLVYIYCSDKSFQSIAVDVTVVMIVGTAGTHNAVKPYFNRKLVQAFATNKVAARFGEETLALLAEIGVEEIGSDRTQHSIAQKFQTLVADKLTARTRNLRTMCHSHFVWFQARRHKTKNGIQQKIRLPVLAGQKPYLVYNLSEYPFSLQFS